MYVFSASNVEVLFASNRTLFEKQNGRIRYKMILLEGSGVPSENREWMLSVNFWQMTCLSTNRKSRNLLFGID